MIDNKKSYNHVVIGSGISAIGAIHGLIINGHKPLVIDIGKKMEDEIKDNLNDLSSVSPEKWSIEDRELNFYQKTNLSNVFSIPQKKNLNSTFFYGTRQNHSNISFDNLLPPFSHAKGGLAEGWGASFLPPGRLDVLSWPIKHETLIDNFKEIINFYNISGEIDELDNFFPLLHENPKSLNTTPEDKSFLEQLKKLTKKNNDMVCGQSRLLIDVKKCQYCGECMSGCVYGSIYKPSDDIDKFINNNDISYFGGLTVTKISKHADNYVIDYTNEDSQKLQLKCSKIYLAAGALNTAKIILNSFYKHSDKKVQIQTRGGYLIPAFSLFKRESLWPKANTLPSIFLEYKDKLLNSWVHIQISLSNELLIKRLTNLKNRFKILFFIKPVIPRIVTIFFNFHSSYAGHYELEIDQQNNSLFNSRFIKKKVNLFQSIKRDLFFSFFFLRMGLLLLLPFKRINTGTYHVGASFPMKKIQSDWNETNIFGELKDLKNLHLVDTSILPSLPGTTIGVLTMSNAFRIAKTTSL